MRQRTQALLFLGIGAVQFGVDAGLFVFLTWALMKKAKVWPGLLVN